MHIIDRLGILVIFVLVTFYHFGGSILQLFFAATVQGEVCNWYTMNFSNFYIGNIFAMLVEGFLQIFFAPTVQGEVRNWCTINFNNFFHFSKSVLQIFFAATVHREVRNWRTMNSSNFCTGIFLSYWYTNICTNIFVSSEQWRVKVSNRIHFSLCNPKAIFQKMLNNTLYNFITIFTSYIIFFYLSPTRYYLKFSYTSAYEHKMTNVHGQ